MSFNPEAFASAEHWPQRGSTYPTQEVQHNDSRTQYKSLPTQRSQSSSYGSSFQGQSLPHNYPTPSHPNDAYPPHPQFENSFSTFSQQHMPSDYGPMSQLHNLGYGPPPSSQSSLAGAVSDPSSQASQVFLTASPEPIPAVRTSYGLPTNERTSSSQFETTAFNSGIKRGRGDDSDEGELDNDHKDRVKTSACLRCRGQKVRCEMQSENESCKRCLNGGHECIIPGPKKRRVPPKREDLIKKIQQQAEAIDKLMLRLTEVQTTRSSEDPTSPSNSENTGVVPSVDPSTNLVVENWISKARDSLAEFGGLIGMGGGGQLSQFIVAKDPEVISSDEDEDDEYGFAIIDSEGNNVRGEQAPRHSPLHRRSTSSMGSDRGKRPDNNASANLPSQAVPFGLMANLSLKAQKVRAGPEGEEQPEVLGVARDDFFRAPSSPNTATTIPLSAKWPPILADGIISPNDAQALFRIFFESMNLSLSLVDPQMYTIETTLFRSHFLFTVICAIASRYYQPYASTELYDRAMRYAQNAAGAYLISGTKNVECVMAYILLSLYPTPAKRWEEERGWIFLGLAIRVAVDINLHLPSTVPPQTENQAREQLNRTRVWLNCHNLDRSTGSQYGKAPILRNDDYIAAHSEHWYTVSPHNLVNFDIHISGYNDELRAMSNFRAKIYSDPSQPTGLNKEVDLRQLACDTDEQLQHLAQKWFGILDALPDPDNQTRFRTGLLRLAYNYACLCCLSYGFHYAFSKKNVDEDVLFNRCLDTACAVVRTITVELGGPEFRTYHLHGPDAQRVFVSFAAAFMIKLTQPKYARFMQSDRRSEILALVQDLIHLLDSPDVAVDAQHGPKLYARFLQSLLDATDSSSPSKSRGPKQATMGQRMDGLPHFESPTRSQSSSPASLGFSSAFEMTGVHNDVAPQYPSYMATPLPFSGDEIKRMMTVTDPQFWPDMALPGYGWMAPPPVNTNAGYDNLAYGNFNPNDFYGHTGAPYQHEPFGASHQ